MKRIISLVLIMVLCLSLGVASKGLAQTFEFGAKYNYIRSCPGGGGIFLVSIEPNSAFTGKVFLNIIAPYSLNAELNKDVLDMGSPVAEIRVSPSENISSGKYNIGVAAVHVVGLYVQNVERIKLEVEVFDWESTVSRNLSQKRDLFIEWLETEHPEFGIFPKQKYDAYNTYPELIIVEHGTFLSSEWEIRVCDHVMIPPDDWSMIWIRKRGALDALFAAKRETDNSIHEIPISEYPIMFGY